MNTPYNIYARTRAMVWFLAMMLGCWQTAAAQGKPEVQLWPDGTEMDFWFSHVKPMGSTFSGKTYVVTDHGVKDDSTLVQTEALQHVFDLASQGRTPAYVVIPKGVFVSGALRMCQGVHLFLREGAELRGSTDIADFPVCDTRIEGQSCKYFPALINVEGLDGFKLFGKGTIDGQGLPYWKAFWLRRSWNPQCTNKDEQRPRLLYVSHSSNVEISGVTLQNSPFWTCHLYKSDHVLLHGLRILSPYQPVKAPSTDAVDIDACHDVIVRQCYMSVNDDAVALKGGKGVDADKDERNGANERILIEDCEYGFCHSCLTCGSESIHNRNVILRRAKVKEATRVLWLKMRPDTPQHYEYITVENVEGSATNFIYVYPWTQFFDLQGRKDIVTSRADHITMRYCKMTCRNGYNISESPQYTLTDFTFEGNELLNPVSGGKFFDTNEAGEVIRQ